MRKQTDYKEKSLIRKEKVNSNSALITRNSGELSSAKRDLELVKIANLTLQDKITDKDRQISEKNELIRAGERVLETTQSQLTTSLEQGQKKDDQIGRLEIKLDEKNEAIRGLKTVNEKKDGELERKNEEIERLKNRAGLSQEELLAEKLRSEKGNLDLFVSRLEINLEQIHSLAKYHERLLVARKNHNQANIDVHEANIARVKQEFSDQGTNIIDIREICQKCERIAEFSWELSQIQQQYEARQEVPPRY